MEVRFTLRNRSNGTIAVAGKTIAAHRSLAVTDNEFKTYAEQIKTLVRQGVITIRNKEGSGVPASLVDEWSRAPFMMGVPIQFTMDHLLADDTSLLSLDDSGHVAGVALSYDADIRWGRALKCVAVLAEGQDPIVVTLTGVTLRGANVIETITIEETGTVEGVVPFAFLASIAYSALDEDSTLAVQLTNTVGLPFNIPTGVETGVLINGRAQLPEDDFTVQTEVSDDNGVIVGATVTLLNGIGEEDTVSVLAQPDWGKSLLS